VGITYPPLPKRLFLLIIHAFLVITSFELALRDIALLDDLAWSLVIVDEVHRVKNTNSGTTKAFHRFQSLSRFGLTGTAIQNNYTELWTILDWTNPKKLGTRAQWNGFVVQPLTIGQSVKASEEQRVKGIVSLLGADAELNTHNFLRRM
jgi:DNA excision repair protein ERCC-6-like 2